MSAVRRIAGWVRRRRAMRRRFNPYVVGTPVFDGSLLFGREQLTRRVVRLLSSRSVRIMGEHRIGKTSFLHRLHRALLQENGAARRFAPVFVDLEGVTASRLFDLFMEETLETLAPGPRALAGLRLTGCGGYRALDLAHDVKRVVKDVRERTGERATVVLLVDEADAVLQDPQLNGDPWLDALLEECSEELRVVLAGASGRASRRSDPPRLRGRLKEVVLEPLHPDDARALVTRPVAHSFRYEPQAVERIVQLARGRPYLVQKLCLDALNRILDEGRTTVRLADVGPQPGAAATELPRRRPAAPWAIGSGERA